MVLAGREATALVLGTVPILIIAGTIEAFISPTTLAIPLKFAISGALVVLLGIYLFGMNVLSATANSSPSLRDTNSLALPKLPPR